MDARALFRILQEAGLRGPHQATQDGKEDLAFLLRLLHPDIDPCRTASLWKALAMCRLISWMCLSFRLLDSNRDRKLVHGIFVVEPNVGAIARGLQW